MRIELIYADIIRINLLKSVLISVMKTIRDFNIGGKRVLVRCDFNVPLDEKGNILDDFRIIQTLPTIEYLIKKGAKLLLMSHLGRPKKYQISNILPSPRLRRASKNQKFSLKPIALRLEGLLNKKVKFFDDCIGKEIQNDAEKMQVGEILLLENLRFHGEEEENNENFAKELSKLGDIYINDAFGACHRVHASIVGVPKYLPSGAGLLLEKEVKILSNVLKKPWRPFVVIIGGVKISTKIKLIEQFLKKADHLLLGGEIADTVLRAKRIYVGKPLPEPQVLERIDKIELTNPKLHLPIDGIVSLEDIEAGLREGYIRESALGTVRKEEKVYDIGPETVKIFSEIIKLAKMIVWSGPLGMFENEKFETGTKEIAKVIVRNHSAFKIAGGGDTDSALHKFGLRDKFDHVSTGGGSMLKFLSGEELPGIEALRSGR